jgi:hypothetical protein
VHPPSIVGHRPRSPLRLRPGNPAAPREVHLPLLPSGPDGVRRHLPRGDRILITIEFVSAGDLVTSGGDSVPHDERFGYRAAQAPHLARPQSHCIAWRGVGQNAAPIVQIVCIPLLRPFFRAGPPFGRQRSDLRELDEVAAGIVEDGDGRRSRLCWLHEKHDTKLFHSVELVLNVVDGK